MSTDTPLNSILDSLPVAQSLLQNMAHKLPDGGAKLRQQGDMVMKRITELKRVPPPDLSISRPVHAPSGGDKVHLGLDDHVHTQ